MMLAAQAIETVIRLRAPLDLRQTLGPLLRGTGDPTMRFEPDGTVWRATRTPAGAATLRLRRHGTEVRGVAWGPGAADALDTLPDLLGENDRPELLVANHRLVAELARRLPGMRLPRTHRPFEALLPSILEQKVTNTEAWRGYRGLLRRISEPAPGPMALLLPASADAVAVLPYFALHPFGIERRRADLLRRAAGVAPRLEHDERDVAYARLRAISGIGPWTVAEVGRVTYGDPDAVSVGDFHLPSLVAWCLAGERRSDDARMLELLEPYRGQRGRVQRLLELSGLRPPRHGPRLAPRRFEAS
jgi:3-methyladenine DNA glycosylase/8-oxoguanine DNA glycosylase